MIMLPIPPVIAWTVGAIGAVVMSKLLAREWRRVNDELDDRDCHSRQPERPNWQEGIGKGQKIFSSVLQWA